MSRASRRRAKKERKLARQRQRQDQSQTTGQAIRKAANTVRKAFTGRNRTLVYAPLRVVVPDDESARLSLGMT